MAWASRPDVEMATSGLPKSAGLRQQSVGSEYSQTEQSWPLDDRDLSAEPDSDEAGTIPATRVTTKSSWKDPGPPPNGGLEGWTQAIMGHLVVFTTWGYINSFGVFQSYYARELGRPPSDISWVGSIQVFLLFFIGTFSGRLTDAGYFRAVFLTGSALQLIGVFMTSLSTKYWHLLLAQGVCTGLGNGFLFCP